MSTNNTADVGQERASGSSFINVGERTNVTGSAKFRKLIEQGDYQAALSVARQQVEAGAQISADPTSGINEKNPIITPQKIGAVIPAIPNAKPPRMPCAAAATTLDITLAKIKSCDSLIILSRCSDSNGKIARTRAMNNSPSR